MKLCMTTSALALVLALVAPARADVMVDPHLSGTGDNVVFDSISGTTVLGSLNGMHDNVVRFTDLSGNAMFSGGPGTGNDIKISNTSDVQVQVFDSTNTIVVPTGEQVFSLKGTGDVSITVTLNDKTVTDDLGTIDPNAQSGFTLTAINGEVMTDLVIDDTGGVISDLEHYRIDVVPGPVVGAGLPGLIAGCGFFAFLARRRRMI